MTQEHPIRPPHELVQQWVSLACENEGYETWQDLATQAARWGADQELEACCKLLELSDSNAREFLTAARRPKPPSLKEQAQSELHRLIALIPTEGALAMAEPIRRALESLPE